MHTPLAIRIVRWSFCGVIILGIIAGLYVSGSPATRRRYALDERRVNSLSQLTYALDTYVQTRGTLPTTLELLAQEQPYLATELNDPATGVAYEYRPQSTSSTYELCATFDLPSSNEEQLAPPAPVLISDGKSIARWDHGAGRTCYALTVRPLPSTQPKPVAPTL